MRQQNALLFATLIAVSLLMMVFSLHGNVTGDAFYLPEGGLPAMAEPAQPAIAAYRINYVVWGLVTLGLVATAVLVHLTERTILDK